MPSVGSTDAVLIADVPGLIQNLGPDSVWIGGSDVDDTSGVKVLPGQSITTAVPIVALYGISSGTSDVRFLGRCTGIFSADTTPAV